VKRRYFAFYDVNGKLGVSDINEEFDDEFFQSAPASVIEVCGLIA